jgi:hypothetical protein
MTFKDKTILLIFLLVLSGLSNQTQFVYNQTTNVFQGAIDDYSPELLANRMPQASLNQSYQLFDTEKIHENLGVSDWGHISTNIVMNSYPTTYTRSLPPCAINQPSLTLEMLGATKLPPFENIYDHIITQNLVFILTSAIDVFFYEAIPTEDERGNFSIKVQPSTRRIKSIPDFMLANFGTLPNTAGIAYHKSSNSLWLATNIGAVKIDIEQNSKGADPSSNSNKSRRILEQVLVNNEKNKNMVPFSPKKFRGPTL